MPDPRYDDLPGVELPTGLEPVQDQAGERARWRQAQADLEPRLRELRAARDRAVLLAHNIAVTS